MPAKKIPTIIGIILVLVILGITVFVVSLRTRFFSRANPQTEPKKVLISNLKPNQFSVSFLTDSPVSGFINYGPTESMGNIVFDKRDKDAGRQGSYTTHFFTITGLLSAKKYYFKIGSGSATYGGAFSLSQNCQDYLDVSENSNAFSIILPASATSVTARSIPISGVINTNDGKPAWGSVVCAQIPDAYPMSDVSGLTGSFIIPLVNVVKRDNILLSSLPDETELSFLITGVGGEIGSGKVLSKNDHPVPPIILGKNFDFIKELSFQEPAPTIPSGDNLKLTVTPPAASKVELVAPIGSVEDTLPTFRGKGEPGQILEIQVQSEGDLRATVKVDQNGFWTWTPPTNLVPGEHTVTITTRDSTGNLQKIVRNFQVLAASPLMPVSAGTPSATIKPATPTPTSIPTNIPIPTSTPWPTSTPTLIPTAIPTIEVTPIPPPESGLDLPYYIFLCLGIGSLVIGMGMMFLNKKVKYIS